MNNLPGGAELLSIAREALVAALPSRAEEDARYTLLMVANAMAIAAREIEAGDTPAIAALARLDKLYGKAARELTGAALRDALCEHERQLALDIRAGRFDAQNERQSALIEHLRESVAARLRISSPKSLKR